MKEKEVIIRGYGDIAYPWICTFKENATEKTATQVIEKYLAKQTEFRRDRYDFEVRTADDSRSLFCYLDGKIYSDHRNDPEPEKVRKRVRMKAYLCENKGKAYECIYENTDYEDEADLHMDVFFDIRKKELKNKNVYFEVYSVDGAEFLYGYDKEGRINIK